MSEMVIDRSDIDLGLVAKIVEHLKGVFVMVRIDVGLIEVGLAVVNIGGCHC